MKAPLVLFGLAVIACNAIADPYSAAMRQAKNVSAKVTAADSQQVPDGVPAQPPQQAPAQSPALQATLQNIGNLRNDLATICESTNSDSIATNKTSLLNDMTAAAQGTKPSQTSVSQLADDLTTAVAGNDKLRPQYQKLAQYVHASFNGAHLTPAQEQMIFGDMQKTLIAGGAAPDSATNVVNDIESVVNQTK
jgi:hypothetical protein